MTSSLESVGQPARGARETDEALWGRLAQRDEGALRELHRRYAGFVFGTAARIVGAASAEEIVQDVFVTLWDKHASFDPSRGSFKPWLVQVARRRALNALRSAKARGAGQDDAVDELASDALPPDEAQWRQHRQAVLRAAVEALPHAQRQALSLAYFDELTHEQIARVLGTPVGTTKTRIRLAIKRLAPAVLAALAAVAIVAFAKRRDDRAEQWFEALKMVTASDVVPLRLMPTPDAPPEAHGIYRSRQGARIAVLTTSHLAPLGEHESYVAWARGPQGWQRLGPVVVEDDARSLVVAAVGPSLSAPAELEVTREAQPQGGAPSGAVMLRWQQASDTGPR
jgi:RNA polymerase sigma-70 factor (ECF subfamily)